ncbi:MBL fold metallo-hydrolase [Clostridium cibarium]|uniref:MBL fold metallo-hydrolase n=1 Tax=Clostridium cibarium TaxID=2762247 RepID=A0ABR8PVQ9_9CLOT|nr:MBL fold metallo-hydrolase [Clostridium cibarium]MBD7912261.1 MBL fold metallo-hydrolase [Clostridium cibarium]
MKIANGVEMLEINSNIMGMDSVINPTLIWDKDTIMLVDAGYPGQLSKIREEIEKTGIEFNKLNKVLLTHQDIDHIGSLSSILESLPNEVKVFAHIEEKAYINGEKVPVKLAELETKLKNGAEELKMIYEKLKTGFENCKVNIDKTLTDGEELQCCGGIIVIFTPGHTPGHISLYLKESKTLIAGDLLMVKSGKLVAFPDSINFDNNLNEKSLKKLLKYDIETVICYHGGIYKGKVNERIERILRE